MKVGVWELSIWNSQLFMNTKDHQLQSKECSTVTLANLALLTHGAINKMHYVMFAHHQNLSSIQIVYQFVQKDFTNYLIIIKNSLVWIVTSVQKTLIVTKKQELVYLVTNNVRHAQVLLILAYFLVLNPKNGLTLNALMNVQQDSLHVILYFFIKKIKLKINYLYYRWSLRLRLY